MGPLHNDPVQAIQPHINEKLYCKNCSTFEFGFMVHLIEYNLKKVLTVDARGKAQLKKVYSILIATLESSQFVLVNKTSTLAIAWSPLKSFYRKRGGQFVLLLTQFFWYTKMVEGEDLYKHLTTMSNLADELEDITRTNVTDEDFMMTVFFSIMVVLRYSNIVKIIMNGLVQQRGDIINKLTTTEQ